jgi:hypothetical protein
MDRRKDKRFRVNAGGFARLRSKPAKLGKIIDISRTGLALNYIDRYGQLGYSSELDLLFTDDDAFFIDRVSFKIISDVEISSVPPPKTLKIKRMGLHFEELTDQQFTLLEFFIRDYSKDEIALNQSIYVWPEECSKIYADCHF